MASVEFRGVSKTYDEELVLQDVNLTIKPNSFTTVYGPPGCGKSVLVRLIAGLEKPTSGKIMLRGTDATEIDAGGRNIGYVPQAFALYPHYSVFDNIAYPLNLMGAPQHEVDDTVREVANQLSIDPLLNKRPDQLSGGEKQRVALARGIVKHTDIFVLDDPLAGLDFKLREQLFDDLRELQGSLEVTFVYTTSDPLETLALADDVAILDDGRIIEAGPVEQVYWHPEHARTIELLGFPHANMVPGDLDAQSHRCRTDLFEFSVDLTQPQLDSREVQVAIRPQHIALGENGHNEQLTARAEIMLWEDLGGELLVHLDVNGIALVTVVPYTDRELVSDSRVSIGVSPRNIVLFARDTGQRVGHGVE